MVWDMERLEQESGIRRDHIALNICMKLLKIKKTESN